MIRGAVSPPIPPRRTSIAGGKLETASPRQLGCPPARCSCADADHTPRIELMRSTGHSASAKNATRISRYKYVLQQAAYPAPRPYGNGEVSRCVPRAVENIPQLLPETETIAVVVGASELERFGSANCNASSFHSRVESSSSGSTSSRSRTCTNWVRLAFGAVTVCRISPDAFAEAGYLRPGRCQAVGESGI